MNQIERANLEALMELPSSERMKRKRVKDPDELTEIAKKFKPRHKRHKFGKAPKNSLFSSPKGPNTAFLREAQISPRLLTDTAVDEVEKHFRILVHNFDLNTTALRKFQNGETDLRPIIARLRGRLFEELISRDFILANPGYFVTNVALTHRIVRPVVHATETTQVSLPDHLVFTKSSQANLLVGFMEDKKDLLADSKEKLWTQLTNQRSLWQSLASQ